jgi:hypothetical protein
MTATREALVAPATVILYLLLSYCLVLHIYRWRTTKKKSRDTPPWLACTLSPKGEDFCSLTYSGRFLIINHFLCRFQVVFRFVLVGEQ